MGSSLGSCNCVAAVLAMHSDESLLLCSHADISDYAASIWYGEIFHYKITGEIPEDFGAYLQAYKRKVKRAASRFVLVEVPSAVNGKPKHLLGYRERNGSLSRCLLEHEVEGALQQLRKAHGHFATAPR